MQAALLPLRIIRICFIPYTQHLLNSREQLCGFQIHLLGLHRWWRNLRLWTWSGEDNQERMQLGVDKINHDGTGQLFQTTLSQGGAQTSMQKLNENEKDLPRHCHELDCSSTRARQKRVPPLHTESTPQFTCTCPRAQARACAHVKKGAHARNLHHSLHACAHKLKRFDSSSSNSVSTKQFVNVTNAEQLQV